MRIRAAAAMSLLTLAACSAQTHSYDSATELRSAAVNAGLHCTGYNPTTPPKGAKSAGECVGGTPASFVVYDDEDSAEKGIVKVRLTLVDDKRAVLVGPNWYVLSERSELDNIKDAVGGKIQGPPTS